MEISPFRSMPEAFENGAEGRNELNESPDCGFRETQEKCPAQCGSDEGSDAPSCSLECAVEQESPDQNGEKACPDEAFDDVTVLGHELLELRVGLTLLEKELDLPTQTVEGRHDARRELARRKGGKE